MKPRSHSPDGPLSRSEPSCLDRAVALLSRRSHFESEIRGKLRARRYPAEEIDRTLEKLRGLGYLDDRATAEQWVAGERRRRPQGRRRLSHRLERKGVDPEIVAAALDGIDESVELEEARRAADDWTRRHGYDPRRLARHLDGRGFGKRAILVVLEERSDSSASSGFEAATSDSE
ncbi:MAG TPA: regulatory protein RecX [Thermoanaerobaculia bacterium]|nr:regulatory protein RecX [Thermoanaerobaculia bacterium]